MTRGRSAVSNGGVRRGKRGEGSGRWASVMTRATLLLLCWGLALGCETVELRPAPEAPAAEVEGEGVDEAAPPPPAGRVTALSVGPRSSCAIVDRAALWCWGSAGQALLGESPGPGPVRVAEGSELSAVSVAGDRVCYVAQGVPHCFGVVRGFGFPADTYYVEPVVAAAPQPVRGVDDVEALALGQSQSCFLAGGAVRCLGNDRSGAGRGARSGRLGRVMAEGVRSVAAGAMHTCVADAEGEVWCWGDAGAGQLPGTRVRSYTYERSALGGVTGVRQLAAAPTGALTCALGEEDAITCWGAAGDIQSREGMRVGEGPVALEGAGEPIARVAVGRLEVYAIAESGALHRYAVAGPRAERRARGLAPLRTELEGPERVETAPAVDVGVGLSHTCALGRDGHVRCWGLPIGGRLGAAREEEVSADEPVLVRFESEEDR